MSKALALICVLPLVMTALAYGQDLEVVSVTKMPREVVLLNKETGQQWVARQGEEVEGWRVDKITSHSVTLRREEGGKLVGRVLATPQYHGIKRISPAQPLPEQAIPKQPTE